MLIYTESGVVNDMSYTGASIPGQAQAHSSSYILYYLYFQSRHEAESTPVTLLTSPLRARGDAQPLRSAMAPKITRPLWEVTPELKKIVCIPLYSTDSRLTRYF